MTARKRGRPPADGMTVAPKAILREALSMLDANGLNGLTMRALAARAGINPMTIYHHFKDRDGLIRALAELVYADVVAPKHGDAMERARCLMRDYYVKVVLYPSLTLAIFARPAIFPDQARRITAELTNLLGERSYSSQRTALWTHILVDYTHGAALAASIQDEDPGRQPLDEAMFSAFQIGLAEILEAFDRSAEHGSHSSK